jgi:hypothetical protein
MGEESLGVLCEVKDRDGFLVSCDSQAALMTDIIDLDRFHLGRADESLAARILGIEKGDGFVQFVPAGLRTTLAYPTPIQRSLDFSIALKSPLFIKLSEKYGEKQLLNLIKRDALSGGRPIKDFLETLDIKHDFDKQKSTAYSYVSGVYGDGLPWSGVIAQANMGHQSKKWNFAAFSSGAERKEVTSFIEMFQNKSGEKAQLSWNGGYMLNAELVGKLGLPESYIGSPLGLIISETRILCPPLFNKPAFLIFADGRLDIRLVNSSNGLTLTADDTRLQLDPDVYNPDSPAGDRACYYDLLYTGETIPGNGRTIIRIAGNIIKEIIHTVENENVPVIPVGLVLSFPKGKMPENWNVQDKTLEIRMTGWEEINYAIEAGPMLINGGKCCIDMKKEGWKTINSIRTQAARLDFTDMRGPKIAIGLDQSGVLSVLTINGRIRESVGASHFDMAHILINRGIIKGMGFDPGGSSTLVVDGKVLNISPYNSDFETDVLSLPPEPRPVGSAVLGWQDR